LFLPQGASGQNKSYFCVLFFVAPTRPGLIEKNKIIFYNFTIYIK
jgi:hypothetical protein